ncbi:hypothetical protein VTO42DRAFT_8091 [Malbranchea cinnamomea]
MASLSSIRLPPRPAVSLLSASLPLLVLSETNSSHTGHFFFKTVSSLAFLGGPLLHVLGVRASPSAYAVRMTAGFVCSLIGDVLLVPARRDYYDTTVEPAASPPAQYYTAKTKKNEADWRNQSAGHDVNSSNNSSGGDTTSTHKITTSFQLGVVAFAAAHVAYILAFLSDARSISWRRSAAILVGTTLLSKVLGVIYPSKANQNARSWAKMGSNLLNLDIPTNMKPLVTAYALIIGSMMAVAASVTPSAGSEALRRQRLLGAAMFVASDVFVAKDAFGKKTAEEPRRRGPGDKTKRRHWLFLTVGWGLYFGGQMVLAGTVG